MVDATMHLQRYIKIWKRKSNSTKILRIYKFVSQIVHIIKIRFKNLNNAFGMAHQGIIKFLCFPCFLCEIIIKYHAQNVKVFNNFDDILVNMLTAESGNFESVNMGGFPRYY